MDHQSKVFMEEATSRNRWLSSKSRETLRKKSVCIIGVSGIGWPLAHMLLGVGIGQLYAVDDDTIETVNINRLVGVSQNDINKPKTEALAERWPNIISVVSRFPFTGSDELLRSVDLIIVAVDSVRSRMDIQSSSLMLGKLLVDTGAGFRICNKSGEVRKAWGQVIIVPPNGPCLVDHGFDPYSDQRGYSCGNRLESRAEDLNASSASLNHIVASLAVEVATNLLLSIKPTYNRIVYDHLSFTIFTHRVQRRNNCPFCGSVNTTQKIKNEGR